MGVQAIANYLDDKGIPTSRKNGNEWHDSSIRLMLTNRHYMGDLVLGRSMIIKKKSFFKKEAIKKGRRLTRGEWIVIPNHHEPLISREQFEAVQDRMKERASRGFGGRGQKSLFASVAFCANCGSGMNYKNDRESYVCSTCQKKGSKKSPLHIINHSALKQAVLANLKELINNSLNMQ